MDARTVRPDADPLAPAARVRLDELAAAHAASLFEGLRDARIYAWLDEPPPPSLAWLQARYRRLETRLCADGDERWLNWAVWSCDAQGYIGTVQATLGPDRVAHLAWVLFPAWWGRGLAREAAASMMRVLRETYAAAAFRARIDARNTRSIGLVQRLGFRAAGRAGDRAHDVLYRKP
jgi:RimJ/RimL family protein N-acetyltransferase